MSKAYDVVVVGLGAMGSAALYQLSKRNIRVLGIDQFSPPHSLGSTHGESRITRQAIGEGSHYVPLVLRSYDIWKELEKETKMDLLTTCGGLIMTSGKDLIHHGSKFFEETIASAKKYYIKHDLLESRDISKHFPQFKLSGNERGYFEYVAGFLRPENCISAQLMLARKYGAIIHQGEKVLAVTPVGESKVRVKTDKDEYEAEKVIVSVGPWISNLLEDEYKKYFKVYRQVLYWFETSDYQLYDPKKCPIYIWEFGNEPDNAIYGFPALNGPTGGVKIASEQVEISTDPENVAREVREEEKENIYKRFIRPHFNGLTDNVIKAVTCLYTVTPDSCFVIDTHPQYPQIILASPCSGHGFKHSAAIGEVLAEMATDTKTTIDISKFTFRRFFINP